MITTYTYDQANRLKTAVQDANTYTFGYNGVGDRLSQTVGITTTRYVLDPGAGLTQVLSDGTNTYLYGAGRLAQYQASMQYFGADGLGSVRQLYDASAMVLANTRYDPYGNLMSQYGTATSVFGFTGEQQDSYIKLLYLRARWYDYGTGRFTQADTILSNPMDPPSLNRFAYVNDNPVNFADPTGHDGGAGATTLEWSCYSNLSACIAAITALGGVVISYTPIAVAAGVTGFLIWYSFAHEPYPLPHPLPTTHPAPPTVLPKPWTIPEPCYWSADGCKPVPAVRPQPKPAPQPPPQPKAGPLPKLGPWDPFLPPCPPTPESEEVFFRGTTYYDALRAQSEGFLNEALKFRQRDRAMEQGLYTSRNRAVAEYFGYYNAADFPGQGGVALMEIVLRSADFASMKTRYNIQDNRAVSGLPYNVPQPHVETLFPYASLPELFIVARTTVELLP